MLQRLFVRPRLLTTDFQDGILGGARVMQHPARYVQQ
jgi:hypothetical protein